MVGFVAAVFAEVVSGAPVAEQLGIAPLSIGLVFALFTVASLVPILRVRGHFWSVIGRSSVKCWPSPLSLQIWLASVSEPAIADRAPCLLTSGVRAPAKLL